MFKWMFGVHAGFYIGIAHARKAMITANLSQQGKELRDGRHPGEGFLAAIDGSHQLRLAIAAQTECPLALGDTQLVLGFKTAFEFVPIDRHETGENHVHQRFGLGTDRLGLSLLACVATSRCP